MNFLLSLILPVGLMFLFITLFVFILFLFWSLIVADLKGAPYVRSSRSRVRIMLELAAPIPGEVLVDLGSGDGTLLIEAARKGAYAVGLEINPFLVGYSRWRAKRAGLAHAVTIIKKDMRDYPLHQADIVFLYLWPSTVAILSEKLRGELKPGARVVSNAFALPGWNPIQEKERVFLYRT
jgi:precorrin-6B methylase 2